MAENETPQDFKDILAAYDIPDVPSSTASQGVNMQRTNNEKVPCPEKSSNDKESNHCKPDPVPKTPDSRSSSDGALHQLPTLHNYMDRESDFKLVSSNGLSSELSAPPKQWKAMEKELNLYQITANALPAYVPSVPPHARPNMNVPADGIKCLECGDTFLFEHNLMEHLQRRSVLINFNCDSCKKPLIYYNRCTLKNHIRLHHERNEPADVEKVSVMVLPHELMNGYPSFASLPFMQTALMQQFHLPQPLPLMISSQVQQMSSLNNSKPLSPNITSTNGSLSSAGGLKSLMSPVQKSKYSCSECCQSYENAILLEEHFGCSQNLPLSSSHCSKCSMTCTSKCSLAAHARLHDDAKPYVCPECGLPISRKEVFTYHISLKCMHYNRVIGYKCSTCLTLYTDPVGMRNHIIAEHTEAYHKCQACPMAFKSGHSLDSHKKTAHLTMDVESKTIYKCPLCDTVFEGDKNLNEHLDAHIKEQIQNIKFVFKCLTCEESRKSEELFMTKSSLQDHISRNHPEKMEIPCPSCNVKFNGPEDLEKHISDKHPMDASNDQNTTHMKESLCQNGQSTEEQSFPIYPSHEMQSSFVCSNCNETFQNLNGHLAHKKTCGSLPLHCIVCQSTFETKEGMIEDGRKHLSDGVLVCLLCSNHAQFESKKALFKHIEVHVRSEGEFKCDLCSSKCSDSKEFLKHLRSEHGFNPVKCDMCDVEFYGTARMQRHKASAHVHENPVKLYICPLCNDDSFTTQGFLDKHFIVFHNKSLEEIAELRNRMPVQSQQSSAPGMLPPPANSDALNEGEKLSSKNPMSGANVDNNASMDNIDESTAPPPTKKLTLDSCQNQMKNFLTCYKCQFMSDDRSIFGEHIATHKTDPLAYQCCECGTCFVAVPSLRKHMFLEHGIRDLHTYLSEVGQNVISNVEDLATKACCSFNCDVCCQSFVNESSLKNHMRNHGVAFVKSHSMSENDADESN